MADSTAVSTPPAETLNNHRYCWLVAASSPPLGLNATAVVKLSSRPVAGSTGVRAPAPDTENTKTVLPSRDVTASSCPFGLNATDTDCESPVGVGAPTGLRAPPAATENTETPPCSATASDPPPGLNATDQGSEPVDDESTAVSSPSAAIAYVDTEPPASRPRVIASRLPSGLNATACAYPPAAPPSGVLPSAVSTPSAATEKTDTSSRWPLAVASRLPSGLNASEQGLPATDVGGPTAV